MKINDIKATLQAKFNLVSPALAIPKQAEPPKAEEITPAALALSSDSTVAQIVKTEEPAVTTSAPADTEILTKPIAAVVKPARKSANRKTKDNPATSNQTPDSIETIVAKYLRPRTDYDLIPNCGRKPSLLKAGAEHLAAIFKFRTSSEVVNRVNIFEKNFVLYEVATTVYNSNGEIVAVGLGSCNSLERKFIKQGFAMSLNTVLKMARKRSYVDAILSATGSSRIFTQDIEELAASVIVTDADTDQ